MNNRIWPQNRLFVKAVITTSRKAIKLLISKPVLIFISIVAVLVFYVSPDDTKVLDKLILSPVLTGELSIINNLATSDSSNINKDNATITNDINYSEVKKQTNRDDTEFTTQSNTDLNIYKDNAVNASLTKGTDGIENDWDLPEGIEHGDIPEKYKDNLDGFEELLKQRLNNKLSDDQKQSLDPILFAVSTPERNGQIIEGTHFSPYSIRIYAAFSSNSDNMKGRHAVLVKWYDSAKQTEFYQYLAINKNASVNYIWREKPYWEAGTYSVDIFELDNEVRPLASGIYTIENKEEYYSYLALYGSYEDMTSRNIFSSGEEIFLRFNYSTMWPKVLPLTLYYQGGQNSSFVEAVQLDSSIAGTGEMQIKYSEDIWRIGAYDIALQSEQGYLLNKTIFHIIE